MTDEEKTYLNKLLQIYHFFQIHYEISDWSTKNIGTFLVKTMVDHPNDDLMNLDLKELFKNSFDEIDDAFTQEIGNVSWPDIAMMYNLKDFRVLTMENILGSKLSTPAKYTEPEACEVYDPNCSFDSQVSKRYSSFQSCFNEISNNYQSDKVTRFRKEDKMEKAIQSSPCQNLEKFQNCSEYCAWHNSFFGTIGEREFIQAMSFASPQRKINKKAMPDEKKMAGTVKDSKKNRLF